MAGGRGWPKIGASWLGGSPGSELEAPALFFFASKDRGIYLCAAHVCINLTWLRKKFYMTQVLYNTV
jgi:hypothetical protein